MPRGYRFFVFALGLTLSCANHANAEGGKQQTQSEQSIAASLSDIAAANNQQAERSKRSDQDEAPCGQGQYGSNADLCAQWKAADAASDSAWWAWAVGITAIISTFAVLVAIGLTYQANGIARDTAKRQLRAYVGVAGITFEIASDKRNYNPIDLSTPGLVYPDFIKINVKNFGQTPATGVCCRIQLLSTPLLASPPPEFPDEMRFAPTGANIETRHYLHMGEVEPIKFGLSDANWVWKASRKEVSLFIAGRIFYTDTFGEPHCTKFAYTWEPWHPHGERFVPIDRYNGEDDRQDPVDK
jgi:hypothetical protein